MINIDLALAEFVGAFIGDGCMSRYFVSQIRKYREEIQFTGAWKKDSEYYKEIISGSIKDNFGAGWRIYHRKDDDTVRFFIYNERVIKFLHDLGYKFGPKAKTIFIPTTILKNRKLSVSCLRGIFNTDGTVYSRYSKRYGNHHRAYLNYKVVQFKSISKRLVKQIKLILDRENIKTNRIIEDNAAYVLRITSQDEITKFISVVDLNHKYHIQRIKNIEGPYGTIHKAAG